MPTGSSRRYNSNGGSDGNDERKSLVTQSENTGPQWVKKAFSLADSFVNLMKTTQEEPNLRYHLYGEEPSEIRDGVQHYTTLDERLTGWGIGPYEGNRRIAILHDGAILFGRPRPWGYLLIGRGSLTYGWRWKYHHPRRYTFPRHFLNPKQADEVIQTLTGG